MRIIKNDIMSKKMYRNGIPMWECGWEEPLDPNKPFYIEDVSGSANTLSIVKSASDNPTLNIEYSTDLSTWDMLGSTSDTPLTLSIPAKSRVYLRCECDAWNQNNISCSGNHNVGGNITSLIYGSNFNGQTSTKQNKNNAFRAVMKNNAYVVDASNLILPDDIYGDYAFDSLFYGCTALTKGPYMPATTARSYCYQSMFYGCTSLVKVYNINLTSSGNMGCKQMFKGCTSLVTPPKMSSISTVGVHGLYEMFNGCSSLTSLPTLTITGTSHNASMRGMFEGCTGVTDASMITINLPDKISYYDCSSMFSGCTSLVNTPIINAPEVGTLGCGDMFKDCTSLVNPPDLSSIVTVGDRGLISMFEGCTSLTKSPILNATSLVAACYDHMFYGCTSLSEVTCYATSGFNNCWEWLKNVAANGTFKKPAGVTGWSEGISGIPTGWTVVDL